MASSQIRALLAPPDPEKANERALEFLNTHYPSIEEGAISTSTDFPLEDAIAESEVLQSQVGPSSVSVDSSTSAQYKAHSLVEQISGKSSCADQ
jgi:hypothetical protein